MRVMKKNSRLDIELVKREIFNSVGEAVPYIMAGEVLVNGQVIYKRDHSVSSSNEITIKKNMNMCHGALTNSVVQLKSSTWKLKEKRL